MPYAWKFNLLEVLEQLDEVCIDSDNDDNSDDDFEPDFAADLNIKREWKQ